MKKGEGRATLGFVAHTGWAAMISAAGPPTSPLILLRRRLEMIASSDRETPRFAYHAARELPLDAAERLVSKAAGKSLAKAKAAIEATVAELASGGHEVVASGIVVGNRPPAGSLATILKSHALIHSAEGDLFRQAIKSASEALKIPIVEIRARDLPSRAAELFRTSADGLEERLAAIGRSAGRPWAKDQKESLVAALLAAAATGG